MELVWRGGVRVPWSQGGVGPAAGCRKVKKRLQAEGWRRGELCMLFIIAGCSSGRTSDDCPPPTEEG